jgi:hypothetical protein
VENSSDPLHRRTLLKSLAAAFVVGPLAQGDAGLTAGQIATLAAIAEVVLPSAIGAGGRDLAVQRFAAWVRDYREGADMGHGYGASTLRRPSGPPPGRAYPAQFDALDAAARAAGAASFAALAPDRRRPIVEAALESPERVTRLPAQPTGANLVADFMGLYFSGSEAWDLAYERRIGRDRCRALDGSENRPEPLRR